MALTETQKLLIRGLRLFNLDEETQEGIFLSLQNEAQQWELMDFLCANKTATEAEIIKETIRILKKN